MELIKASEMKSAFVSLFNIYAHELSRYNPWLGTQIDIEGNYLSKQVEECINDQDCEAFCITENSRPIGFAVFSYSDNTEENLCSIDEIFLIETSRRKGICEAICKGFWSKNKGMCILHVLKANHPANIYWKRLIEKCGYTYEKKDYNEQLWCYEINLGL
ncbi:GNAT family N-acetyltransferase [Alloiococcus sp. CFN-8]|uniref:GNAT family N-acetyltransferase n=1 Tax=Alloiococcus sp. CFN-8 TaxID=3416081 RepID=UPI003CED8B6E